MNSKYSPNQLALQELIVELDEDCNRVHQLVVAGFKENRRKGSDVVNSFIRLDHPLFWYEDSTKKYAELRLLWDMLDWDFHLSHQEISGYGGPGNHKWCYSIEDRELIRKWKEKQAA